MQLLRVAAVDVYLLDDLDDGPARVAEMHLGRVESGYRCDILRNIPMIYSTKLNPRHMCYIYIYNNLALSWIECRFESVSFIGRFRHG